MPVFAYRALRPGGRTEAGVIDAASRRGAWQELRARGVFPTELDPADARPARGRRVGTAELAGVTRQLATLVAAHLPVAEALEAASEQAASPAVHRALTLARARVRAGEPLADALAACPDVFPGLWRDVVRAGETSGALDVVLLRLAEHAEQAAAVRARLRAALTYPAVMTLATAAVLAFVLAWVVPEIARLFGDTGTPMPLATRVLLAVVGFGAAAWPGLLLLAVAATFGFRAWARTPAGRRRLDAMVLASPYVGRVVRAAAVARFARTLATLVGSGVPLEAALGIATPVLASGPLESAAREVREAVRRGEPLATALGARGVFPPLLVRLAAAGERGGSLGEGLEHVARAHDAEVAASVATATALLEPILILAMGGVVLLLVVAVLLPIFSLNEVVR